MLSTLFSLFGSFSEAQARAEIIRLGVEHQLTSKYTSYVAVQARDPTAVRRLYMGPVVTQVAQPTPPYPAAKLFKAKAAPMPSTASFGAPRYAPTAMAVLGCAASMPPPGNSRPAAVRCPVPVRPIMSRRPDAALSSASVSQRKGSILDRIPTLLVIETLQNTRLLHKSAHLPWSCLHHR